MGLFFDFFIDMWNRLYNLLNSFLNFSLSWGGLTYRVGYFELIIGFIVLSFAIGVFWKGARK